MSIRALAIACVLCACGTKTPSTTKQQSLETESRATLSEMAAKDPGLSGLLQQAGGYAVFPNVGSAGALVAGGAFGKGILYQNGAAVGYVELKQGSVGLEVGGQSYSELIVLRDAYSVEQLKANNFTVGAGVTAVVIQTGAAASTRFESGSEVFVLPRGGLMAGVAVSGQKIGYQPLTATL